MKKYYKESSAINVEYTDTACPKCKSEEREGKIVKFEWTGN